MLTPFTFVLRSNSLRHGVASISLFSLLLAATLAAAEPRAGRLTGIFEGIECEYSPGQEELARELAQRFVRHNLEVAAEPPAQAAIAPLSPVEMRANRAIYLGHIAALLALEKPTSLQEECFDAFLDCYEQSMRNYAQWRAACRSLQRVKHFAVWERAELVRRLELGEKIAGFGYDAATKSGRVIYGTDGKLVEAKQNELAEKREKLRLAYTFSYDRKDGIASTRGGFGPKKPDNSPPVATSAVTDETTEWLPVIIPADLPNAPAAEMAARLWGGPGDRSLVKLFEGIAGFVESLPSIDPQIAFLILHETTEVGIVDRYFTGSDRRWFCDGMANYIAWRVARDLHGEPTATRVYDLPAQLQQYAGLRKQADLRKWPATENQSDEDQHSRLNSARYAFATQAVALMNERAGEDILPKLFAEIGRTPRDKVSIKTVEQAWKKLTGTKLDTILAEAVKPLPKPAK